MKFIENNDCPIYSKIISSDITVHGRKASDRNRNIKIGDKIIFQVFKNQINVSNIEVKVTNIKEYADIEEFVKAEGLDKIIGDSTKCLNINNESDYAKYYSKFVDEKEILKLKRELGYGFLAFHIEFVHEYKILRKKIQEILFKSIKTGKKKIVAKINTSWVEDLDKLDRITWLNDNDALKHISTYVTDLKCYSTFEEMLEKEGLKNVLPGIETIDEAINIYNKFYSAEDEMKYGIVAIHLELLK
jgi:ASC-1-like (ASCH) protein